MTRQTPEFRRYLKAKQPAEVSRAYELSTRLARFEALLQEERERLGIDRSLPLAGLVGVFAYGLLGSTAYAYARERALELPKAAEESP